MELLLFLLAYVFEIITPFQISFEKMRGTGGIPRGGTGRGPGRPPGRGGGSNRAGKRGSTEESGGSVSKRGRLRSDEIHAQSSDTEE